MWAWRLLCPIFYGGKQRICVVQSKREKCGQIGICGEE